MRLNTICPYFTMFPVDFPFQHLSKASSSDWVLDPFCGRGTTNFAARLRGIRSYGTDTSPIACSISAAKFVNASPKEIIHLCSSLLKENPESDNVPEGRFWDLCYHPATLSQLCVLRDAFMEECSTDEAIALRAILLGILHGPKTKTLPSYLSNQMPRTYSTKPEYSVKYWEKHALNPEKIDLLDVVSRRANYYLKLLPPSVEGGVLRNDSRQPLPSHPDEGFNWIITSPPYFGMKTYVQDQWLRNWFLGGPDSIDYTINGQLIHTSKEIFAMELAAVWKNMASVCAPDAKMAIRFGALPSYGCDPYELLHESIEQANCGWEESFFTNAVVPKKGRRQSDQFGGNMGTAREEIDYYATLT